MKIKRKDLAFNTILYSIMIIVMIITLYPFLNVLAMSFNDSLDTIKNTNFIIPRKFTLDNYVQILHGTKLLHAFLISVLRTVIGVATSVICSCMLAYTISREDYVFQKFVTGLFLLTMYVGGGMIPGYLLIRDLHLMGSFWVYIIPGLIGTFNVIVVRSFIDGIPASLQESARIDGANDLVIFYKIIMPLCLPVIATIALFVAVGQWNSWFDTYLFCGGKPNLSTLQYELKKILDDTSAGMDQGHINPNQTTLIRQVSPESIRMAITVIATVPILVVYPFMQKYFVTGLTLGAVKS